jgi:hypothetical protein
MPKTKKGFVIDDSPLFTKEEWTHIQSLKLSGKDKEVKLYIHNILLKKKKDEDAQRKALGL